jgi:hypothetical protein
MGLAMKKYKTLNPGRGSLDEKIFDISVPVYVKGKNAAGEAFNEQTRLKNISSKIAVFLLENKVFVGTKLQLKLDIPKTLILKNQLNLIISGEVERTRRNSDNGCGQIVEISLAASYKIIKVEKDQNDRRDEERIAN